MGSLIICLAVSGLPGGASATEFDASARLDLRGGAVDTYALDDPEDGGGTAFGARLRLDATARPTPAFQIVGQLDLAALDLYGANPELEGLGWTNPHPGYGNRNARLDPRHLYFTWTSLLGQLRVGAQGSQWGLGLLASDGDSEAPGWGFGTSRQGDLVLRALWAFRPLAFFSDSRFAEQFFLAVGTDLVYRDENAELVEGDRALQAVVSGLWRSEPGKRELGIYLAYRAQKDRADTAGLRADLNVLATDLYGRWEWELTEGISAMARGELALLSGHTTRLRPEAAPEGVDVLALGWATHGELRFDGLGLSTGLWAVYASGDQNSEDTQLRRMRLDPDFRPSLILFESVLADTSARARARIADPARTNIPQAGSQFLPTAGSVTGAFLLGPVLRYQTPLEGLSVKAGLMWARATADLEDPYASFASGGTPENLYGDPPGRDLGLEIDVGVRYEAKINDSISFIAAAEGGLFLPGDAFGTAADRLAPIKAGYLSGRLHWRLQ